MKKILFVDDEETLLDLYTVIIENAGYVIYCAESGQQALEILKREKDIHVMFFDLQMPEMNGIDLCKRVRKMRPLDCIYALTAFSSVFHLVDCIELGFNDYFQKPFEPELLFETIDYSFKKLKRWQKV